MVVRICRFDGGNCNFSTCDFLDSYGDVILCKRHRNKSGFFARRVSKPESVSVFGNKHLRGDLSSSKGGYSP